MSRRPPLLVGVERTLLGPLCARASESTRPLSLLRDRHAVALATMIKAMVELPTRRDRAFGPALRTWMFDQHVARFLAANPRGTVVELGAGLNTRFERLDNGRQWWFDLDLPRVISLREHLLPRSPRRTHIAATLTDLGWVERVAGPPPYCFVLEAVLAYLQAEELRTLLSCIAQRFADAEVIFDPPRRRTQMSTAATMLDGSYRVARDHPAWQVVETARALDARQSRRTSHWLAARCETTDGYQVVKLRRAGAPLLEALVEPEPLPVLDARILAFSRLVAAFNNPSNRDALAVALAPDVRIDRHTAAGECVETFLGVAEVSAWIARIPAGTVFSLESAPVLIDAAVDLYAITYGLHLGAFANKGRWHARLAEDGRIAYLVHQPDPLP